MDAAAAATRFVYDIYRRSCSSQSFCL